MRFTLLEYNSRLDPVTPVIVWVEENLGHGLTWKLLTTRSSP
ncbi:MAG: hypothetical protein ACOC6L_02020 [Thermodesulfobacteriota bacterium]